MCGIVGIVGANPGDRSVQRHAAAMARTVAHRGPDAECVWADVAAGVALGHRRLAILDLSSAAEQPLANERGTVRVVFNGEIYNFLELRQNLKRAGHVFHTRTDGEVIAHAYEEYGADFLTRLDGMFAIALWDGDERRLILARDRPGKKPLYYQQAKDGSLLFGSEVKAILAHPGASGAVDPYAIPLYFTYGYVPCPRTFYTDVVQVPPGSYVVYERGVVHAPVRYWTAPRPDHTSRSRVSEGQACADIRDLLIRAVQRRLLSDVPLGAFLSGGLDSSIVVGLMSRLSTTPVRTFSIGFSGDRAYDETSYSRAVARHFGTTHTEFIVEPKAFDLVERLLWHHDQPYGDSSAIPTYLLAGLAREHVTVALNGDGGDELFAGYGRFRRGVRMEGIPAAALVLANRTAQMLLAPLRQVGRVARFQRAVAHAASPLRDRYLRWCSFFAPELLQKLLLKPSDVDLRESFDACFDATASLPVLEQLLHLNFHTYLPDDLLVKVDRTSMAHGLETRSPFLDTALVEYAATLPADMKLRRGQLKYILKKAFADFLPGDVITRPKQGFAVPLDAWFRTELKELVGDVLLSDRARYREFLSAQYVVALHDEHQRGIDHGSELWALLNFEMWLRKQPQLAAAA